MATMKWRRAAHLQPSYLALWSGLYPTETKQMPWQPQGLSGLKRWQALLPQFPWVAIGGINPTAFGWGCQR